MEETLIGVDFSGARDAAAQRKKIIAIAATRLAPDHYSVEATDFNSRLVPGSRSPGWTAQELAVTLCTQRIVRVAAFDFPFSLPQALLEDEPFAASVGHVGTFATWAQLNRFVATKIPLQPPIDLSPFSGWHDKKNWKRRVTDVAAGAQPPLKDKFQFLMNMTLLGNSLLSALAASGRYRIVPFDATPTEAMTGEVIEVYPGVAMKALGFPRYKQEPIGAISTILDYCATNGIVVNLEPAVRHFCETYNSGSRAASDPDGSDALIALATAILYREGCAFEIGTPEQHTRQSEGVIWGLGKQPSSKRPSYPIESTKPSEPTSLCCDVGVRSAITEESNGMREESKAFLTRLLQAAGPSNYEIEASRVWRAEAETFCAEVTADVNGNTIARLRADVAPGAKKVLLAGHIDEIGLIITHVNDDGTLAFRSIGGWDAQVLIGQRLRILTRGGHVTGVIGRKAAHLMRGDDRDRGAKIEDLWIDIGASKKEEAAARVRVGDAAVIDVQPVMLTDDLMASRAHDDRCCAFIALETLRLLSEGEPPQCDVYAAATVQEEITFRGAHTVAATLAPDVAIALDVTHASDRPGSSPQEVGAHAVGSGAAISRGSVSNEALVDLLIATAEREGLPYTLEASGRSSGTDADAMVVTGRGTAGGVISVPCRYMHSPVEIVSLTDLETCAKLLAATIRAIGPETDFVPK